MVVASSGLGSRRLRRRSEATGGFTVASRGCATRAFVQRDQACRETQGSAVSGNEGLECQRDTTSAWSRPRAWIWPTWDVARHDGIGTRGRRRRRRRGVDGSEANGVRALDVISRQPVSGSAQFVARSEIPKATAQRSVALPREAGLLHTLGPLGVVGVARTSSPAHPRRTPRRTSPSSVYSHDTQTR